MRRSVEAGWVELRKVCVAEKFASFEERWSPKTLVVLNDYAIKAVKLEGPFLWHDHPEDDEVFYVLRGAVSMEYRIGGIERVERFGPGELLRVPKGVDHRPVADAGTELLLFERESLVNTGTVVSERTRVAEQI